MEIVSYDLPTSWDDKNMDWESPDPRNPDYLNAIRMAIYERSHAGGSSIDDPSSSLFYRVNEPLRVSEYRDVFRAMAYLGEKYLNVDKLQDIYPPDPMGSLPVNYWRMEEIVNNIGDRVAGFLWDAPYNYPSLCDDILSEWLIAAKKFLQKLRYYKPRSTGERSIRLGRYGGHKEFDCASARAAYNSAMTAAKNEFIEDDWYTVSTHKVDMYSWCELSRNYDDSYDGDAQIAVRTARFKMEGSLDSGETFVYGHFTLPVWGGTSNDFIRFAPEQMFPNDNIIENHFCRITVPVIGNAIDFLPLSDKMPLLPAFSDIPPIPEKRSSAGARIGFAIDSYVFIRDGTSTFQFTAEEAES